MIGDVGMAGRLRATVKRAPRAPVAWRMRNVLRWGYLQGWVACNVVAPVANALGVATATGKLSAVLVKQDGTVVNYGVLGWRVVTNAFVNFMVDQLQTETTEWGDFKYHDSGVGSTGENATDTDIETTDGEARVEGTQTEGASANIYRSVGTIAYTTTKAIVEHGLFSQSTGTTLMDRTVFSTINVENGDSIEFTYELTCSAGS